MNFDLNKCLVSVKIGSLIKEVGHKKYFNAEIDKAESTHKNVRLILEVTNLVKGGSILSEGKKVTIEGYLKNNAKGELKTKEEVIIKVEKIHRQSNKDNIVNLVLKDLTFEEVEGSYKPNHVRVKGTFLSENLKDNDLDFYAWGEVSIAIQKQSEERCTVAECFLFGNNDTSGFSKLKITPRRVTII